MNHKESFLVEGLMCGTCLVEVLERLHDVDGVADVGTMMTGDRTAADRMPLGGDSK